MGGTWEVRQGRVSIDLKVEQRQFKLVKRQFRQEEGGKGKCGEKTKERREKRDI